MEISSEHINIFLSKCHSSNWAGVFFSLPFQSNFQFWLQDLNVSVKAQDSTFIFTPFDVTESPCLTISPSKINASALNWMGSLGGKNGYWPNEHVADNISTTEKKYRDQFNQFISAIQSGKCKKAILSTVISADIPDNLNIGEYVFKLREKYPQAFIYILSAPFAGTWIGATPETLLSWKNNELTTMSLAGTKRLGNPKFNFGNKEKNEQKIVTSYIRDIFNNHFSNVELKETEELRYGEMTHLLTRIKAYVDGPFTADKFLNFANSLHPTPAVGGFPVNSAFELIHATEQHSRFYYSGYLGIVGKDFGELVVNLRCMTLGNGRYSAFAGGGITADSRWELEWEETRLKANALLKFLS